MRAEKHWVDCQGMAGMGEGGIRAAQFAQAQGQVDVGGGFAGRQFHRAAPASLRFRVTSHGRQHIAAQQVCWREVGLALQGVFRKLQGIGKAAPLERDAAEQIGRLGQARGFFQEPQVQGLRPFQAASLVCGCSPAQFVDQMGRQRANRHDPWRDTAGGRRCGH